jgi:hypothetical protein
MLLFENIIVEIQTSNLKHMFWFLAEVLLTFYPSNQVWYDNPDVYMARTTPKTKTKRGGQNNKLHFVKNSNNHFNKIIIIITYGGSLGEKVFIKPN